jgi:hypothetical protein
MQTSVLDTLVPFVKCSALLRVFSGTRAPVHRVLRAIEGQAGSEHEALAAIHVCHKLDHGPGTDRDCDGRRGRGCASVLRE